MCYLIIHIIGTIVSIVVSIRSFTKDFDMTLQDLIIYVTLSILFSWVVVFATLIVDYGDKVIIKKRKWKILMKWLLTS